MTSSDVLDTCLNVQLTRAADLLIADVDRVLAAVKKRAFEHKMTPTIGRSHGHPRRTRDIRAQACVCIRGIFPCPRSPGRRPQGSRDLRDFGRGRDVRPDRSAGRSPCRQGDGPGAGADLDASDPARPPRDVFRDARRDRLLGRTPCHRDSPHAAHRSAGSRGIFLRRPERLLGNASQAQPGAVGKSHRPRPHGARLCDARQWRMSCCGTNAISRIPQPSA